jgi:hypothetical protein
MWRDRTHASLVACLSRDKRDDRLPPRLARELKRLSTTQSLTYTHSDHVRIESVPLILCARPRNRSELSRNRFQGAGRHWSAYVDEDSWNHIPDLSGHEKTARSGGFQAQLASTTRSDQHTGRGIDFVAAVLRTKISGLRNRSIHRD